MPDPCDHGPDRETRAQRDRRACRDHAMIDRALASVVDRTLAHLATHGPMTLSQLLYTSEAQQRLHAALEPLRDRPIERRPWIATSSTVQHRAVYREVESELRACATRIGWRAGSAVWGTTP